MMFYFIFYFSIMDCNDFKILFSFVLLYEWIGKVIEFILLDILKFFYFCFKCCVSN